MNGEMGFLHSFVSGQPNLSRICAQVWPASSSKIRRARRPLVQLPTLPFRQSDRVLHEHDHTTCSSVTHHSHVRLSKSQANEFVAFSQAIVLGCTGQGRRRGRGQENPRIHYLPGHRLDAGR